MTNTTVGVLVWLVMVVGTAAAQPCAGDCAGDGSVAINELILGVNLALGAGAGTCAVIDADGDGAVQINELVGGVANALADCRGEPATRASVARRYADLLVANYGDAIASAEALQVAIAAFVAAPSAAGLEAVKTAWLAARPAYLQTEMARFYDGPIDNADTGVEGFLNAWPMNEAYVDYVVDDADAGIVNAPDLCPVIDTSLLLALNEGADETTISSGWHAIEFLLWSQDLSDSGPGARPFTDYVTAGGGTAANQARRGAYLRAAATLLIDHLTAVRAAWEDGAAENYRDEFLAADPDEALRRLLTGMGTLSGGELTGERLGVVFETKDQEDEHSCFADNTHVDHRNDQIGIQNAFLGRYGAVTRPGIYDLVRAVDPTLAGQTRGAVEAARVAILAIPVPFDQAIRGADSTPGRQAISAAIAAVLAGAGPGNATFPTIKSAVDKIVNQMIFLAEEVADAQLLAALGTRTGGTPRPDALAASRSENGLADVVDNVTSLQNVYFAAYAGQRGQGFEDVIVALSSSADAALALALQRVFENAGRIPPPLEAAVVDARPPVERTQVRAMELMQHLEVDLVSVLGTTLRFNPNDGD